MFCDRCGATLQPDQRFCGRCGKDFSGAVVAAPPVPNRVQEHIRLLGILWLAEATLTAVAGVVMCIVGNTVFAHMQEMGARPEVPAGFLRSLFTLIGIAILVKAAVGFLAGWGLLQREPWARILTIVLSFLALVNLPLGTALGIYSLWVLLPAQSEREYEQAARRPGAA
jgi:hypothetical protein